MTIRDCFTETFFTPSKAKQAVKDRETRMQIFEEQLARTQVIKITEIDFKLS
jgi:hypothetical protein